MGASNLIQGYQKLAQNYNPFKSHFVNALNTVLFYKKNVLHDKNRTFSMQVFSCRFSVDFLDFLKTSKIQHQKFLCKYDFFLSIAFLWFDFQFHQYLCGRPFTLETDQKPLESSFNEKTMAAARVQRWVLISAVYDYTIKY